MVKSKKGSAVHCALQDAVVAAINDPLYVFTLPALSDWQSVVSCTAAEKQRLEFVGDAVMHLSVALCLYQLFPDASPGLYTNIRSAVNTNATFTHLMVKTGAYQISSQSQPTKAVADSFEVIVAALYMERGFAGVLAWVHEQYAPLVAAARRSHDEHISAKQSSSAGSVKRPRTFPDSSATALRTIKLSTRKSSPRRTMMARHVINGMKSKGLVKLRFPSKKPKLSLEKRLKSCEMTPPPFQSKGTQIIDLTLDSDSEDLSIVVQCYQASLGTASGSSSHSLAFATTSRSRSSQHARQDSNKTFTCYCPPEDGRISEPAPLSHPLLSPCVSCHAISMLPTCARPLPSTASSIFKDLKYPPLPHCSNITQKISGSYGNPIVIDDSDAEGT